jgi:hypothetical protein
MLADKDTTKDSTAEKVEARKAKLS